jgi:hypothetical protein
LHLSIQVLSPTRRMVCGFSYLVVDGTSRSGYERNGGMAAWAPKYVLPFEQDILAAGNDRTEMKWPVPVTGVGYRANDVVYYLAMVLFFCHALVAVIHQT